MFGESCVLSAVVCTAQNIFLPKLSTPVDFIKIFLEAGDLKRVLLLQVANKNKIFLKQCKLPHIYIFKTFI